MVRRAVASAARHGVILTPGRANPAGGNCAFEAPIFNVNDRSSFLDNFPLSVEYYRRIWVTDLENRLFTSPFNPGYSYSEWHLGFERLKESNVYEVDYFGDMVIPAIACGLKKNLLIFNTNIEFPKEPITVVSPSDWHVEPNSRIPIILAYNLSHYEGLHPIDKVSIERSIKLVESYRDNSYNLTHRDLLSLVDLDKIAVEKPWVEISDQYMITKRQAKLKIHIVTETEEIKDLLLSQRAFEREVTKSESMKCQSTESEMSENGKERKGLTKKVGSKSKQKVKKNLKKFEMSNSKRRRNMKVRDMTNEERKEYRRDLYREKVAKMQEKDKINLRQKWTSQRANKREKDDEQYKEDRATEKSLERAKKRDINEGKLREWN